MRKEGNLVQRLNYAVSEINAGMGPSQTNLILHGPIDRSLIADKNLDILESNEKFLKNNYENHVFPKTRDIVRVITRDNSNFPKTRKKLNSVFDYRTAEDIREKLRNSYEGQFELDSTTARHLFSREKIYNGDNKKGKFYFNKNSEYMFSKRYKILDRRIKKLDVNFEKMIFIERANFLNFVVDTSENNCIFWSEYNKFTKNYSKEVLDMMLGDMFGIKIIDLNQERAEKNMNRIFNNYAKMDFHNFSIVKKKVDDHRQRGDKGRPGGIHCIFIDKKMPTHPIEVQYVSIKDECANLFGKRAHYLYNLNGKKSNFATGD